VARSFLNTDWEELEFGESTEKLITIEPDPFTLTVGEPSADIEFDSFASSAHKRTKIAATRLA